MSGGAQTHHCVYRHSPLSFHSLSRSPPWNKTVPKRDTGAEAGIEWSVTVTLVGIHTKWLTGQEKQSVAWRRERKGEAPLPSPLPLPPRQESLGMAAAVLHPRNATGCLKNTC